MLYEINEENRKEEYLCYMKLMRIKVYKHFYTYSISLSFGKRLVL